MKYYKSSKFSSNKYFPRLLVVIFVIVIAIAQFNQTVFAVPNDQYDVLRSGIHYFNTSGSTGNCPTGPGGTVTLIGKDNIEKTINFFTDPKIGLSLAQAIGIAANFAWETGGGVQIDPTSGGSPSAGAFGIAQWTPGSKFTQDKDHNHITGSDTDLAVQLQVVWDEMNGKSVTSWSGWASNLSEFKKINDAGQAADYFRANFEGCDTSNASCTTDRVNTANQWFNSGTYGNGSGGSTGSCTPVAGQGTVDAAIAAAKVIGESGKPYCNNTQCPRGVLQRDVNAAAGYDCSSSTSWVLLTAGFTLPGNVTWGASAPVSGDYVNWGDPGPGQQMTIWANADHVFIQFNAINMQMNTSPGPGPKFIPWGGNGEYDANSGNFVARHWPGT